MSHPRPSLIRHLVQSIQTRRLSVTEHVRTTFRRARAISELNAFLHLAEAAGLRRARTLDALVARGVTRPLLGVPIAVKDNLCVAGQPMTCASRLLDGFDPGYDATVVTRLVRAGAIVVGKTNLDEFGMGSTNEHSAYGPCRNPWDPACSPGGSSGGSAAAVAAGVVPAALGSDTGGSVRIPAAMTGIVGLRPTYGAMSRYGLTAHASSMDQVGPMARTVTDVALLYSVMAGPDPRDATTNREPIPNVLKELEHGVHGFRVGLLELHGLLEVDPPVLAALNQVQLVLKSLGARIVPVSWPSLKTCLPTYHVLACAEASSNLARFDGIRYGRREPGQGLEHVYAKTRGQGFGDEVKRRILLGTHVLRTGYRDDFYRLATAWRTHVRRELAGTFQHCDLILTPTVPVTTIRLGSRRDPVTEYELDLFAIPASLAGLPALSIPAGSTPSGMPIGVQLVGPAWSEPLLLRAARAIERSIPPPDRAPLRKDKQTQWEEEGP